MASKKDEDEPKHAHKGHTPAKPHKAPAHSHASHAHDDHDSSSKKFVVSCQDGSETTLTLSKSVAGKYPSLEAVQNWFTSHGDKRDGKCAVAGCAVCLVEVEDG